MQPSDHTISSSCPCEDCRKIFRPTVDEKLAQARSSGEDVAVRIEIQYESGEIWQALGTDAFEILRHWRAGETMNYVHGFEYSGPKMRKIKEKN